MDLDTLLAEEHTRVQRGPDPPGCSIGKFMQSLSKDDAAKLTEALAREDLSASALARVFAGLGLSTSLTAVKNHRAAIRADKNFDAGCSCRAKGWL